MDEALKTLIDEQAALHAAADEDDSFVWEAAENKALLAIIRHSMALGEDVPLPLRKWVSPSATEAEEDDDDSAYSQVMDYLLEVECNRATLPPVLAEYYAYYEQAFWPDAAPD